MLSLRSHGFWIVLGALIGAVLPRTGAAQCVTEWSSGTPRADLGGSARCSTLWDPDGAGPRPSLLVVGGQFLTGGLVPNSESVLTFDGTQWEALPGDPFENGLGVVKALASWNGELVVGGFFLSEDRIVVWNGVSWRFLGFAPGLRAMTVWNGNLVAARNLSLPLIEVWNGSSASSIPRPPQLAEVNAVVAYQGNLCVAGSDSSGSGVLERWTGTAWLPTIVANGAIRTLAVRSSSLLSTLYAGGDFTSIGGVSASRIASTSGTNFAWSSVGNGLPAPCEEIHVRATSQIGTALVVRTASRVSPVMQLVGGAFVGMGTTPLRALAFFDGAYHGLVSQNVGACLRYDGLSWLPVAGRGIDGEVRALAAIGADMIVGGTFQTAEGAPMSRIARWTGSSYTSLDTGIVGSSVDALLSLNDDEVVAGGLFSSAGGVNANNIAGWNGTAWAALGTGCDQQVLALARLPNGDLVAGGRFSSAGGVPCSRIARWNGSSWSPIGGGMNGDVLTLAVRRDGTLIAGGAFTVAGGVSCSRIAQWNGVAWSPLGSGTDGEVHGLAVRQNQEIVAVGAFRTAGGVPVARCALWTGSTWLSMAAGDGDPTTPAAVIALPAGDVIAGRGFHQPSTTSDAGISRWNGSTWSGIGSGLSAASAGATVAVRALAFRADGVLIVGGSFGTAGALVSRGIARLTSTCSGRVADLGGGCSDVGPLTISGRTSPLLGASFNTATTGIAPGSLCLQLLGFSQTSIPLSSILTQGVPGCTLMVQPDVPTTLRADSSGVARFEVVLPTSTSLLFQRFYQQTIPIELDSRGALVAVRASNTIMVTIGTM
ncbi:MAG: hypothetical protein AB7I19_00400 [Planctomycetota bacterium]